MAKSTDAELLTDGSWQHISIDDALATRPGAGVLRCPECGGGVRAHKEGTTGQGAHFEHRERHDGCPRSPGFDRAPRPHRRSLA